MTNKPETSEMGLVTFSDADLLDAWIRDSEQAAFSAIVHRYSVMVLSVCRRRCRSVADADDAYQTTFLYLARNASKIRRPECLPGWLHRVAQRSSVATLSGERRDHGMMIELPAKPNDPLDRLTQRHEAIVLDEELAALPDHYRTALVMHVFDDEPLAKLAERFGTTVGSIRGRLQRGKKLLAQRLRKRGVVPVLAFAAANAWTVSTASAADAGGSIVDATSGDDLPEPPIDSSLLDSLLLNGKQAMSSVYGAASLLAGAAVVLMMCVGDPASIGHTAGDGSQAAHVVTIPAGENERATGSNAETAVQPSVAQPSVTQPSVDQSNVTQSTEHLAQFGSSPINPALGSKPVLVSNQAPSDGDKGEADKGKSDQDKKARKKKKRAGKKEAKEDSASGGGGQADKRTGAFGSVGTVGQFGGFAGGVQQQPMVTITKSVRPTADSQIAETANELLDQELDFAVTSSASTLAKDLSQLLEFPVLVDNRAIKFAELSKDTAFELNSNSLPIRTALSRLLQPHGLKATVQNKGIVITADHNELVRRGIGVSKWININDDFEKLVSEKLQESGDFSFTDEPLQNVIAAISKSSSLPIRIDELALEEIGLSLDQPVSIERTGVTLRSALKTINRPLQLSLVVFDETLLVTTPECSESRLLTRIYWLESTGYANGDFDTWINMIQTSFWPDTWEALGGPSTINPMTSVRPALLVSSTYEVHKDIERFLNALREAHIGPNPVLEEVEVPAGSVLGGTFGGGMGGGGMGGGGGFM